ncbi:hypothetical protein PGT21_023824 [Puccinia graminis f. sp. tritici]|uniref:Uncharacterized protein n=1 Tax=Puccinia graminis f. sp. tritici TaxID=56615 RepID=A0A5B0PKE6_PUCGR|nr:hypothetical protein PGT21_023824 [Puccinia graminis f. sp. tritici]
MPDLSGSAGSGSEPYFRGYQTRNQKTTTWIHRCIIAVNNVTDPIPGLVFIGDWIENRPNTGYWDWIDLQSNPNLLDNWDWLERSNPDTQVGSISDPIPNKY